MPVVTIGRSGRVLAALFALGFGTLPARALEDLIFTTPGANDALTQALRGASILLTSQKDGNTAAQDLFADAQAEYGSLLNTLYAAGYYSGVIHITLDGREAAAIAPLDAPGSIRQIRVVVEPGPAFRLDAATVHPLPRKADLPEGFAKGKPAESGMIQQAVTAGIDAWRDQGHAKASVADQNLVADHRNATLSADITLDPGPRLRFGPLTISGQQRMRVERIRAITGLPEGRVYSPEQLDRAKDRLRRTGVFRSITLEEADQIAPPDLLPFHLAVVEEKRRRYTFGAELASPDGATLTGGWLHRNLFGGAERLSIDGEISNIGGSTSGTDYGFKVALSRPATFTPDTTATISTELAHLDEEDYSGDLFTLSGGVSHRFSTSLTGSAAVEYTYLTVSDVSSDRIYRNLALPFGLTWDRRNSTTDATRGFYLEAEAKPFLGFGITDSGARFTLDARGYRGFGERDKFVMAARLQAGAVIGSSLLGTPRDYLFYSGGGGTVRGQPYQSLGVNVLRDGLDTFRTGGTHFLSASLEGRVRVTETIGVVGFVDVGRVDAFGFFDDFGGWQAGAGVGVRYATGVGPIRLDLAVPVGGDTGDGLQIYVGLGQAF